MTRSRLALSDSALLGILPVRAAYWSRLGGRRFKRSFEEIFGEKSLKIGTKWSLARPKCDWTL
jgi:hypothetical protein